MLPIAEVMAATDALIILITMVKGLTWDTANLTPEQIADIKARRLQLELKSNELAGELKAILDQYGPATTAEEEPTTP